MRLKGRHRRGGAHMFIMVRIDASVGRGPVFSNFVYTLVQINVAPNAFRAATATPQYIATVQPNFALD